MIILSEQYPPETPNPHGRVLSTFSAWEEARGFFREHITLPPDTDLDQATAQMVQSYLRQFYTCRWFAESKWFRETFKHSVAVVANVDGYVLRQVATRCSDGIALATFAEVDGQAKYALDDDYHSRRVIEETLVMHREEFVRPSGS